MASLRCYQVQRASKCNRVSNLQKIHCGEHNLNSHSSLLEASGYGTVVSFAVSNRLRTLHGAPICEFTRQIVASHTGLQNGPHSVYDPKKPQTRPSLVRLSLEFVFTPLSIYPWDSNNHCLNIYIYIHIYDSITVFAKELLFYTPFLDYKTRSTIILTVFEGWSILC